MLYFIQSGMRLKIGVAENPLRTEKNLQPGNPEKLKVVLALDLKNERDIKQLLLDRLSYCRCREEGEWFKISFWDALDHIFAIRKSLDTGDSAALLLESDPQPKLEDHLEEFEQWVREIAWADREWNQHFNPLEDYWNDRGFREDFLKNRGKKRAKINPAEQFASIKKNLSM